MVGSTFWTCSVAKEAAKGPLHLYLVSCVLSVLIHDLLVHLLRAGTLLVKEGSHAAHEEFFANVTVLTPEQKAATADFYQFQPEVSCNYTSVAWLIVQ